MNQLLGLTTTISIQMWEHFSHCLRQKKRHLVSSPQGWRTLKVPLLTLRTTEGFLTKRKRNGVVTSRAVNCKTEDKILMNVHDPCYSWEEAKLIQEKGHLDETPHIKHRLQVIEGSWVFRLLPFIHLLWNEWVLLNAIEAYTQLRQLYY